MDCVQALFKTSDEFMFPFLLDDIPESGSGTTVSGQPDQAENGSDLRAPCLKQSDPGERTLVSGARVLTGLPTPGSLKASLPMFQAHGSSIAIASPAPATATDAPDSPLSETSTDTDSSSDGDGFDDTDSSSDGAAFEAIMSRIEVLYGPGGGQTPGSNASQSTQLAQ